MTTRQRPTPARSALERGNTSRWLPLMVALTGLALTAGVVFWDLHLLARADRARFDSLAERLKDELRRRVSLHTWGLRGTRAAYAASHGIRRGDFRAMVASRDLSREFPGALGIGYITYVRRQDLPIFLARTRADGAPDFSIEPSEDTAGSEHDLYVTELIEPLAQNRGARGLDIASLAGGREAAERAMLSGEPSLSGKLALVQAADRGPGFLYLLPLYRKGTSPTTAEERRAAIQGWVYMPIVAAKTFEGVDTVADGELDFEVYDGEQARLEALIYDDDGHRNAHRRRDPSGNAYQDRKLLAFSQIKLGGRTWLTAVSASPQFRQMSKAETWSLGLAGTALSLLLGLLLRSQRSAIHRAQGLAQSMTADLRRLATIAETTNASKSEFLANMSHEIRTPMTAILGYADLLEEETGSRTLNAETRREYCEIIKRNGEHLLSIISDILDISRIEAGKMAVQRVNLDLDELCASVISTMAVKAEAKRLQLTYQALATVPRTIQSDPLRLRQILINLLGNALKFTEVGGVTLSVSGNPADSSQLRFEVIDTGIGISPEVAERLFQAFSQGDASITRKFEGAGLGLRISRRLAQMLGGDITLLSKPGQGSIFSLTIEAGRSDLPGANPASEPTRTIGSDRPTANLKPLAGARILLAEDGPDNQRLIALHLRRAGAEVQIVENGRHAVEALLMNAKEHTGVGPLPPFDLVLMDMQMPEMDGYRATQLLRSKGCGVSIVALTAHSMRGDAEKCLDAGCNEYLAKPIERELLIEVCRSALKGTPTSNNRNGERAA